MYMCLMLRPIVNEHPRQHDATEMIDSSVSLIEHAAIMCRTYGLPEYAADDGHDETEMHQVFSRAAFNHISTACKELS